MKHILRNRCGYGGTSGYDCIGVPRLASMYSSRGLTCDYDMNRSSNWDTDSDIPMTWDKLETFADTMKSCDISMGGWAGDVWVWSPSLTELETTFPPTSEGLDTQLAIALAQWFNVTYHLGSGDVNAPYTVPGVDAITITQLLESLVAFRAAWQAWSRDQEHDVDAEPVYKTYFDKYISARNFIDNYLNLPTRFRGFTTMWDHVLWMDPGSQTDYFDPPEVTCRTDFNALELAGFIDLFDKAFFAGRVDARATMDDQGGASTAYALLDTNLVCFDEGVFEPGLIEPPLPAEHDVPPWPALTPTDAGLDGIGLGLVNENQWENIVNLWLNDIGRSIMHLWGLRELIDQMSRNQGMSPFAIHISTGDVMWWDTSGSVIAEPVVTVNGGTVYVNNAAIGVTGLQPGYDMTNKTHVAFYVHISLTDCDNDGHYGRVTGWLDTSASGGDFNVSIGSVTKVTTTRLNGRPSYVLYQIYQERHTISVDLVRTCKSGLLWRDTSGASPYKILETAPCD